MAFVAPVVLGASAASAAPRESLEYDALGDSYGSGFGVPPYEACGRPQSAYAVLLDGRKKIDLDDFVACAGASTATLVSGGQLDALDDDTDLVTVSIGGNDIEWGTAVGACLFGTDEDCGAVTMFITGLMTTQLPGLLDSVYTQVSAAAPNAHVVVTGYPRLFSPEHGAYLGASPSEQQGLNDCADLLNSVLAEAAGEHGFQFVDVTQRFINHGVNAPQPWILGAFDPGSFHPSLQGYRAYTAALTSQINPARLK